MVLFTIRWMKCAWKKFFISLLRDIYPLERWSWILQSTSCQLQRPNVPNGHSLGWALCCWTHQLWWSSLGEAHDHFGDPKLNVAEPASKIWSFKTNPLRGAIVWNSHNHNHNHNPTECKTCLFRATCFPFLKLRRCIELLVVENLKGSEHYIQILYQDWYGYVYEVHTYLMQSISFSGIVLLKYSLF